MPDAPEGSYPLGDGDELVLRGVLTPKTRAAYAQLADPSHARAAASAEDVWQRQVEFLFERLAVRWTVSGVTWEGQRDLLERFRAASSDERRAVRDALRAHVREWFPDVTAP
jgi:hypothetical protein